MASIRIENKAWTDARFAVMGKKLGIDRDLALIRMGRVWSHLTEEETTTVSLILFDAITGFDGSAEAAVEAGLAERQPEGIRPRGAKGRTEWLAQKRELGRQHGHKGGQFGHLGGRPRKPSPEGSDNPPKGVSRQPPTTPPPAPAPASASASSQQEQDPHGSPAARRPSPPSDEAEELAELLRHQLVAQKTDHAVSRQAKWQGLRTAWMKEFHALLETDERSPERAAQLIRWVFGDQGGSECRFVVESSRALRLKWDRIESEMSRTRKPATPRNGYNPVATGGDADPVLRPLRRKP